MPEGYPPLSQVLDEGVVVLGLDAPGVDADFERALGVDRFAAIAVGDDEYVLSFDVEPGAANEGAARTARSRIEKVPQNSFRRRSRK